MLRAYTQAALRLSNLIRAFSTVGYGDVHFRCTSWTLRTLPKAEKAEKYREIRKPHFDTLDFHGQRLA